MTGIPRASRTSLVRSTCPLNSSGDLDRCALYSGNISERKVLRETSNAAATCVGSSSRSRLINMEVKP
ncbi:Uncharacterised protein [Mycobacteroides abscessus subsp. abscessus]|nr:Uncharacterised protein [Mycobacteroides abscessus subsp. abscessus]